MDDKACDLLNEVDEYFNNRGVNERKFNNSKKYHSYCPYENNSKKNKCINDYERINALGSYLFKEIMKIDKAYKWPDGDKRHIEVFMIWLGDKLFKIENDYKATLEESYKNNLEKIMGNVKYWEDIDSKKLYKKATIKKMSDFYNLLNYICKLIIEYNKNTQKPDNRRLVNYSTQCINFYRTIHRSANECGPYLQLLDSLKMIYENYRLHKMVNNYNIKENNRKSLLNRVKHLTTFQNENRYLLPVNPILNFNDKRCVDVRTSDEQIGEKIASKNLQGNPKGGVLPKKPGTATQGRTSGKLSSTNPSIPNPAPVKPPAPKPPAAPPPSPPKKAEQPPAKPTDTQTTGGKPSQKPQPQTPPKSETGHQSGAKDSGRNKGNKGGGVSQPGSSKGKSKDDPQKKTDQVGTPSPGPKAENQSTGVKNQGSGASGQGKLPGGTDSGTSSGTGSGAGGQGDSSSQTKHSGNPPHGNTVTTPSGAGTPPPSQPVQPQSAQPSPVSPTPSVQSPDPPVAPPTQSPDPPAAPPTQSPDSPQTNSQQTGQQQTGPLPTGPPAPPSQDGSSLQTFQSGGLTSQNEPKDPDSSKGSIGGASGNKGDPSGGVNGGGSTQGDQGNTKDGLNNQGNSSGGPSDQGNPNGGLNNQGNSSGGPSDQGNPNGGSSDPASNTSGGSFNLLSPFLGFIFNGTNKFNQASKFVKENHQKFKDAKDKISDAYNNTVDNLKIVYNASSDYFNSVVSNIANKLNQVDPPSKTGSSGNNSPQNSDPSQKNGSIPPLPPSNPQPNSLPTPPTTSLPNPSPTSPIDPTSQKQPSPQSQPTIQKPAQVPSQSNQLNSQKIGQLVKSLSSDLILKKPWNIFPTTWNGSGNCKPEIKFMNATLVCCTSEQCGLTGITVTLVLIPIILSIAYKYLSFGSSKKSEKKDMKRVINFHDENRKTKIIISSNNRNKDLKPVINLVGGKKDSLLNIYKLIRADPMPFINLFFLLIFFVYKRKRDTIE
ncbi:PIR protein CIR protein [Plasmodium vinckei brucechwatti]|uniref:PIR protein CIR protein n=1 Tax=Plasmodium vinckei brucechwatti TaxID=119398 RepID=A0A6V7S7G2_PLAVN|nr:PIR protein CIR protein [Plasmodium vinckei brucechwatti]